MSYRNFKRMLGETNLERKCRFLFGICLLLLIVGSFSLYGRVTENLVYDQSRRTCSQLLWIDLQEKHWEEYELRGAEMVKKGAAEIVKTLLQESDLQTVILPNRAELAAEEVMRRIDELLSKETWKLTTSEMFQENLSSAELRQMVRPTRQDQNTTFLTADEDSTKTDQDRRIFEKYLKERPQNSSQFAFFPLPGDEKGDAFVYYEPIYARQSCINCHVLISNFVEAYDPEQGRIVKKAAWDEGDVLAVARTTIDDATVRNGLAMNRALLFSTAIVTVFIAMVAAYVIVRYVIVKPLKHLRDVSDLISHGAIEERADIHTGDEFEELGVAFNRMIRHLVAAQQELRSLNVDLDAKVDELAQANMQLYEMNRLRSDFLATMSHELRTPLNSIIGFSEVLSGVESLTDKQRRYCENIKTSGRILLDMINDILDLAKLESGRADVRLTEFSVEGVIRTQCELARPLAEKKRIELVEEIEPRLPLLRQDERKLQQILNNLLSNAVKFTPEGGRIDVRADAADDHLKLVVADTGIGIAREDQQAVFEKFRQGMTVTPDGDAMKREYSGTGLGLSIVKEMCRLLGGSIELHSELGRGSEFTVRLPLVGSPPESGPAEGLRSLGLDDAAARRLTESVGAAKGSSAAADRDRD